MNRAFLSCALLAVACTLAVADVSTLWPMPQSVTAGSTQLLVSTSLRFVLSTSASCQQSSSPAGTFLAPAFTRYQTYMFWNGARAEAATLESGEPMVNVSSVTVCVSSSDLTLDLDTDESM
jgi:hypothetical protein